jgi:hypothetical protein
MAWIEEIQRSVSEPVLAFTQQNWMLLLIVAVIAVMWLFGSGWDRDDASVGVLSGRSDSEGEGDGSGSD